MPGELHPYETDVDTVVRYVEMSRDCVGVREFGRFCPVPGIRSATAAPRAPVPCETAPA